MKNSDRPEKPAPSAVDDLARRLREIVPTALLHMACEIPPGCEPKAYVERFVIACTERRPQSLDEIELIQDQIEARVRGRGVRTLADSRLGVVKVMRSTSIMEDLLAASGVSDEERPARAKDLAIGFWRGSKKARSQLDAACAPTGLEFDAVLETEAFCRDLPTQRALAALERSHRKKERDSREALDAIAIERRTRHAQQQADTAGRLAGKRDAPRPVPAPAAEGSARRLAAEGPEPSLGAHSRTGTPGPASAVPTQTDRPQHSGPEAPWFKAPLRHVAQAQAHPQAHRRAQKQKEGDRRRDTGHLPACEAASRGLDDYDRAALQLNDRPAGAGLEDGGWGGLSGAIGQQQDWTAAGEPYDPAQGTLQRLAHDPAFLMSLEPIRTSPAPASQPPEEWRLGSSPAGVEGEPDARPPLDWDTLPPVDLPAAFERWKALGWLAAAGVHLPDDS